MKNTPRILIIAGSDSSGGAGIQADLKTVTALGCYGMTAITALTAQNTRGVAATQAVSPEFVARQIDVCVTDIGVDAVKIGMLANAGIVRVVAQKIRQYKLPKVVLDPVMVAKSGASLLDTAGREELKKRLLPLAFVVTPNLPEAGVLSGYKVKDLTGMKRAARAIYRLGAKNVLIKGGHLPGKPTDILFDGKKFTTFEGKRIRSRHTHGTGCAFASFLASFLAKGKSLEDAVSCAKEFVAQAIASAPGLGGGHGPINPTGPLLADYAKLRLLADMNEALERLKVARIAPLIPEVYSNLAACLPGAKSPDEVAGIPGRMVRLGDSFTTVAPPTFGRTKHMPRILLTAHRYDPEVKAAMNIKCSRETLAACRKAGLELARVDRRREPKRIRETEGASLPWAVEVVYRRIRKIPDGIYDLGALGKEPIIRIFGRDVFDVVRKIMAINSLLDTRRPNDK